MSAKKKRKNASIDFMLKEYERLYQRRMSSIRGVELHVNYFMAIATAVVGLIVVMTQFDKNVQIDIPIFTLIAFIILILYGFITLNRLISKSIKTRKIDEALIQIQEYFANLDSGIFEYIEELRKIDTYKKHSPKLLNYFIYRLRGSFEEVIVLTISLLVGGLVLITLLYTGYSFTSAVVYSIISLLISGLLLYLYIIKMYKVFQ